jgi:acyl-CoA thioesterase I
VAQLGAEHGVETMVANPSINRNTTRMALERMAYDVQTQDPHVVLVQFAMNDCNYWETDRGLPRVSPAAFKAKLHEIILRARTFGAVASP